MYALFYIYADGIIIFFCIFFVMLFCYAFFILFCYAFFSPLDLCYACLHIVVICNKMSSFYIYTLTLTFTVLCTMYCTVLYWLYKWHFSIGRSLGSRPLVVLQGLGIGVVWLLLRLGSPICSSSCPGS